jgi:hypothetical protein
LLIETSPILADRRLLGITLRAGVKVLLFDATRGNFTRRASCKVLRSLTRSCLVAVIVFGTINVVGCTDDLANPNPLPDREAVSAAVVGAAAAQLDANGRFANLQTSAPDELAAGDATRLANAYAQQFVPFQYDFLKKAREGPIDIKQLAACGRPLYAASAFESLPSTIDVVHRRPFGAWWLITLCAGNTPQVSVAVSALATDLRIENGRIKFPASAGNEFVAVAIPVGHQGEFPSAPEGAAVRAAEFTGRRVTTVPTLIMSAYTEGLPQESRWEINLESSVRIRAASRGNVVTQTLYSGSIAERDGKASLVHYVAAAVQPATLSFTYPPATVFGETQESYQARLRNGLLNATATRRSDRPIKFEIVSGGPVQ